MDPASKTFFSFWLAGVVLIWPVWFWWSVRSRRMHGEPLVPRPPANAIYAERFASGRAHGHIGGAHNCLMVVVTDTEVWLTPIFPFNLIAPLGAFGLDHRVSKTAVWAEPLRSFGGGNLRLSLPAPDGRRQLIDMRLRRPEQLLNALAR